MKIDLFSIGPVTIHGYGLMIGIGVLCCVFLAMKRAEKHGLNSDAILDIAIWGLIGGFLGAKLLYLIVEWRRFFENPLALLGSEGFVVYGGIIAGVLAAIIYCKCKHLVFLDYFDIAAASIAMAQGFGRIGCFLAGCCYGKETDLPIGIVFPEGSLAPAGVKLLPTQLLSSAGNFLIMTILLLAYPKRKKKGDIGFLYMLLYGVGRFLIEFLRSDNRGSVGILSTSQFISLFIVLGGVLLLCNRKRADASEMPEKKAQENAEGNVMTSAEPSDATGTAVDE